MCRLLLVGLLVIIQQINGETCSQSYPCQQRRETKTRCLLFFTCTKDVTYLSTCTKEVKCTYTMGAWSRCSASCGLGTRTRTDTCDQTSCLRPSLTLTEHCKLTDCPVDGGWGDWTDWEYTACSKECCTGFQSRNRSRDCDNPPQQFGGKPCPGEGAQTEQNLKCNTHVCPMRCSDKDVGAFFSHPCTDCHATYFRCEVGRQAATELSCPKGQYWNPYFLGCTRICVDGESASEDEGTESESESESMSESVESNSESESESDLESGSDSESESVDEDCNDGYHLNPADPSCRSFYRCQDGHQYPTQQCPDTMLFDPTISVCNHAANVDCGKDVSDEDDLEEFSCSSKADGFYPVVNDCSRYHWCSGGAKYTMPCPPGTTFDVTSRRCAHAENASCP